MSENTLVKLYIKSLKGHLTESEKLKLQLLRFKYSQTYKSIVATYIDEDLSIELKKADADREFKAFIAKRNNATLKYKLIAAVAIIAIIVTIYFYPSTKRSSITNETLSGIINYNHAQLLTSNNVFDIGIAKKIIDDDYVISVDENNHISYDEVKQVREYHTVITPYRSQYQLTLPDGSIINLNSNSTIKYPVAFNDTIREIYVTGEVFCNIAKSDVPFIIYAKNKTIKVLGTSFNLRNYVDEIFAEVTLVEGLLQVEDEKHKCTLNPGEQVIITNNIKILKVDADSYGSWRQDIMRFYDVSLMRIINSLQQLYEVKFVFASRDLANKRVFGGIVKGNTLQQNLILLEKACDIKFEFERNQIMIERIEHL